MKHYSYTASDLWKRATQLADVENSNFLKYEEKLGYLNDSFKSILQWARNMGEKLYVKEVALKGNGTTYILPDDFYSIVSLTSNGIPVHRKADSERTGGYDIVNDELRVYGIHQNLLLTYNLVPMTITLPDETLQYEEKYSSVVASAGNNVIVEQDGNHFLWNVVTNEKQDLGYEVDVAISLGKGHYIVYNNKQILYGRLDGSLLKSYEHEGTFVGFGLTGDGNATYTIANDSKLTTYSFGKKLHEEQGGAIGGSLIRIFYNEDRFVYTKANRTFVHLGDTEVSIGEGTQISPVGKYDGREAFLHYDGSNATLVQFEDDRIFSETLENISAYPIVLGFTERGAVCTRGSTIDIVSWIPETELNFPNDFYFSAMATDVAVRIAQKQNSNFQGLLNLLESEKHTFVNTMNSSGAYPRMKMI